ncbi:DNA repair protein complementing XP-C cells [Stegostoma tigrinum]|uniref:DNA repair protein complementing XP-C cells n=1 Tax=Stegostoma tigrinum TaxID=3053191 RepID=UPI00202B876F|nr:DNA repair protein complementing XP-C cells [Stegostoma tigrinum]
MAKRKGSKTQSSTQATCKRLKKDCSRTKPVREGPVKCAKQLPPDDSQDFEPEKPLAKPKRCGRGTAKADASLSPQGKSARGKKLPKTRERKKCPSVKEEGSKEIQRASATTGRSMDAAKQQKETSSQEDDSTEDSEDEWEEVEELQTSMPEEPSATPFPESTIPAKPLEIEIESPAYAKKKERREKRELQFEDYLRRMINRFTRNLRIDIHKVHLLCLLANGMFRNRMCNEPELRALALSLVPAELANVPAGCVQIAYISKLLKWFVSSFEIDTSLPNNAADSLLMVLKRRFSSRSARSEQEMVHLFLITLRTLPLASRLVTSLQPVPFKEDSKAKNVRDSKSKDNSRKTGNSAPDTKQESVPEKGANGGVVVKLEREQDGAVKMCTEREDKAHAASKRNPAEHAKGRGTARRRTKNVKNLDRGSAESGFEDEEYPLSKTSVSPWPKNDRRRRVASKVCYKEQDSEGDDGSDSDFDVGDGSDSNSSSDRDKRRKRISSQMKSPQGKQTVVSSVFKTPKCEDSEEDDFENIPAKTKPSKRSSKCNKTERSSKGERMISKVSLNSKGSDQWIEVYVEAEKKWVAVDCIRNTVNQPELCAKLASKPLSYIVSFDTEGCVRDVTQRYDVAWMTTTRKHRVDSAWWDQTLAAYKSSCTERERNEDQEMQAKMLSQPLPMSVAEYKHHPLYVLKRHLLKYEILYPPTAAILGYCKTEAVYSRDCVHTLHSKDIWLKEARVVRDGEVPCKMVKSQSNRARKARSANWEDRDKDDLGLFGYWQTEPFSPPSAVNGKVPRNDFGNVYLFKPCMLPRGCKHLRVPNINRVARKLNIDCAGAVVGFDFHSGHSHPVIDGYIVCEEHVEILLAACQEEEAEMERKEQKKREQRVMGNWKLLVKGLLIREKLKARYNVKDDSAQDVGGDSSVEGKARSDATPVTDITSSWPLNRQEEAVKVTAKAKSRKQKKGDDKHLFPFEKL